MRLSNLTTRSRPLDRIRRSLAHLIDDAAGKVEALREHEDKRKGGLPGPGVWAVLLGLLGARGAGKEKPGLAAGRRSRGSAKTTARPPKGRRTPPAPPRTGRIEALAWFALAGAILAWPRERSPFHWPELSALVRRLKPRVDPGAEVTAVEASEPGRGRSARRPEQIPVPGWKDIVWRAWSEFNADNIPQVAGGVAFFGLLAIFPAMAAFVSLYGLVADVETARKQLRLLAGVLPGDALTLIGDQMVRLAEAKHAGLSVAFVIGLLLSIWSANAGMKAMFVGLNVAFEEKEKRNLIRLNLVSLAFTLGMIAFMLLALGAVIVIPAVFAFLGYDGGALPVLRWPLLLVCAVGLLAVLYRYGPSREPERWRWVTWGGALAALLWLAASLLFSLYVSNFAHYDRTYGSLGAVIAFMSWLWVSTICVLFGAEVNAEIEHQTAVDTTTGRPKPLGERGAHMADTLGKPRPPKGVKAKPPAKPTQRAQPPAPGQPPKGR